MEKLFYFDVETTGLDPVKNGIHQISGFIEIDSQFKQDFNFVVAPYKTDIIEKTALDVAGVTEEHIKGYPPIEIIYTQLISVLDNYVDKFDKRDKYFLVGYNNAHFDNQFLRSWFDKNNDRYFGSWFWSNSIDVMVLASEFLKNKRAGMKDFKLKTVAVEMGIEIDETQLHNALYDVHLTRQIYKIITNKNGKQ